MASQRDQYYMRRCMDLAADAARREEVPVGALCVFEGRVIGVGSNSREADQNPVGHAEMDALRMASEALGSWRLTGVTLYVTLEPCPMCAGASVLARVDRVVYGTDDPKAGAVDTMFGIGRDARLNHRFAVEAGVLQAETSEQLSGFFRERRARAKARKKQKKEAAHPN